MSSLTPINILLVEDNPADVRLTQEAFKHNNIVNTLHVVTDGEEALHFLRKEESYKHAPTPDLILLDLNLPLKPGKEVLMEIKQDDVLRIIPVVVLTTSESGNDILDAYNNHVNCYLSKPVDFYKFVELVKQIEGFWLTVVKLPSPE